MKWLIAILFASVLSASAFDVKLSWTASSSTNAIGYKIYAVYDCSTPTNQESCTNVYTFGNTTSVVISDLYPSTTYTFAATCYDLEGDESDFSNWLTYNTPVQLSLGTWPAVNIPALSSTNLIAWTATNFTILLTNQALQQQFFRFAQPYIVLTNKQPGQ